MDWLNRSSSTTSLSTSRLLSLPAELRNQIFSYAVTSPKTVVTFRLDPFQRDSYQEAVPPPLTRVNRQLRAEALGLWYECNTFVLHTEASKGDDTGKWLRLFESQLHFLRRVEVWLRYLTISRERSGSQGVVAVSLARSASRDDAWITVDDCWRWVTVVRKPTRLEKDAEFLNAEMRRLIELFDGSCAESEQLRNLMVNLRARYIKQKIERPLRLLI